MYSSWLYLKLFPSQFLSKSGEILKNAWRPRCQSIFLDWVRPSENSMSGLPCLGLLNNLIIYPPRRDKSASRGWHYSCDNSSRQGYSVLFLLKNCARWHPLAHCLKLALRDQCLKLQQYTYSRNIFEDSILYRKPTKKSVLHLRLKEIFTSLEKRYVILEKITVTRDILQPVS